MAVEVILGDVEHRGHGGMKLRNRLQLERGNLAHRNVAGAHFQNRLRIRRADIAHHPGAAAGVFENLAQQRAGGGLAVGAGHSQQKAHGFAIGVLQFAHDLHAQFAGARHSRMRVGHAGADDQGVHALHEGNGVLPKTPMDALHVQIVQRAPELLFGFHIADRNFAAARVQKPRRSRAASRHTQHERFSNLHRTLLCSGAMP